MSTPQEKVLEMVARGELSPDQADSLLGAMERRHSPLHLLLHPLDAMTTGQALLAGIVAAGVGLVLGAAGVRFDGALDLHLTAAVAPLATRVLDLLVAWPLVALVLWLGTRPLRRPARVIDFLAAVGVARVVYVLGAGLLALLPGRRVEGATLGYAHEHPAHVALIAIIGLYFVVWLVVLLYNGVKTASGLSGKPLVVAFTLLLIAAEVASKLVLHLAG
jgi:hypothetical protein